MKARDDGLEQGVEARVLNFMVGVLWGRCVAPSAGQRCPRFAPLGLGAVALALAVAGCPTPPPDPPPAVEFGETEGLAACTDDVAESHPDKRCFTWRAVAGVSMGGGTAARLGFVHPELYDIVADMGGPVTDTDFFFAMIDQNHLSGFCPLEQLQALADDGVDLDDATDPRVWCGTHDVWPLDGEEQASPGYQVAVPGSACALFRSDFNHWYRGPEAGRGGGFGRNTLIESIADLSAIYGNPSLENPDGVGPAARYLPPGVPEEFIVPPQDEAAVADRCAHPVTVNGVYNREYNPDGTLPAVTFCDGAFGDTGDYVPNGPGAQSRVMDFALAVDINGNGRRDYAEPVISNGRERYEDVGVDGLASVDEAGYDAATNPDPAGDDFDTATLPFGTEGNFRHDDGEPYDDDGLDGVSGTFDVGEGNGAYDIDPDLARAVEDSAVRRVGALTNTQLQRLDIWLDAGVRDFLNTAQNTNTLFAALAARVPSARVYEDFKRLPGIVGTYRYLDADYSREAMGQVAYLRYGDASICPSSDDIVGSGNHVGPDVVNRLFTLFSFLSARMPAQGRDVSIGGEVADLGSPNGALQDFAFVTSYESTVLGRAWNYGVLLPPDYFYNTTARYPVLYFFHGQGQSARSLTTAGLALWGPMKESSRTDRIVDGVTDLQRAIIIWVDGECPPGVCWTGTFYANFQGLPRDDRRFETAFYELIHHVETTYRVKRPELVDAQDPSDAR